MRISTKIHENRDPHTADDDEQKSATLSYVFVIDDENHENHEIMRDMSTPKWTPPSFWSGSRGRHGMNCPKFTKSQENIMVHGSPLTSESFRKGKSDPNIYENLRKSMRINENV